MKKELLVVLGLTLGLSADIGIDFLGTAYHTNRDVKYNETPALFGVNYMFDEGFEVGASTYVNSYDDRTYAFYVGYRQPIYETEDLTLGVFANVGYQNGYEDDYGNDVRPILFYGGPYAEYKNFYVKMGLTEKLIVGVVGYRFDTFKF